MANWGTPYFLAWTTTPWTLPSNTALCVGPKIEYVAVETYNGYNGKPITVVLARQLLYNHFNKKAEGIALEDYKPGDKLIPFRIVGEDVGTSPTSVTSHTKPFTLTFTFVALYPANRTSNGRSTRNISSS